MNEVFIFYPNRQPDGEQFAVHRLPHREGQDLAAYLRQVRLVNLRTHMRCTLDGSAERLRFSYVPKAGDRIVLRPAGRAT